ncbi:MAG: hypothetical protein LBK71_03595 [Verrucomicrobiales bacterium]|jgi:hypothetical protein|nr:hypothetical protein [Verrucomicrobiales bacterium]
MSIIFKVLSLFYFGLTPLLAGLSLSAVCGNGARLYYNSRMTASFFLASLTQRRKGAKARRFFYRENMEFMEKD